MRKISKGCNVFLKNLNYPYEKQYISSSKIWSGIWKAAKKDHEITFSVMQSTQIFRNVSS